ncbi:MAG: hypothetical protein HY728_00985 [Candidatus Rokubacteria bacterium]|nr:hypothetical protein [Candidatus Rokubacteria bacterium]MBI4592765.1 hypothetical protein [Candidatus Rokubacteria bacterium]
MTAARVRLSNIGPRGQRQRLTLGLIALSVAVVAAAALVLLGVTPGALLAVWPAFWIGALGVIQAREKT